MPHRMHAAAKPHDAACTQHAACAAACRMPSHPRQVRSQPRCSPATAARGRQASLPNFERRPIKRPGGSSSPSLCIEKSTPGEEPAAARRRRLFGKNALQLPAGYQPRHCAWSGQKRRWLFQTKAEGFIASFQHARDAVARLLERRACLWRVFVARVCGACLWRTARGRHNMFLGNRCTRA